MSPLQQRLDKKSLSYDSPFFEWKGEIPQESDNDHIGVTTSIAFQNVHGLCLGRQESMDKIHELVNNMAIHGINILGLSEHNIALANHKWKQKLHESIQQARPQRITHQFDSGPEYDGNGRLMGGTGIIVMDEMTGRLEPKKDEHDTMGRWSIIHLRRQQLPPITVIAIYQVCQSPTNPIGNTSWHQQRRYLDLQNRPDHPRQAFIQDLIAVIRKWQAKHHSIIVGGDWNDWMGSKKSSVLSLSSALNLVDPWLHKHPNDMDFATYEFGQHRIDSVLISLDLLPAVTSIRYSPGGLMCTTDHRAVVVTFHTKQLMGAISDPLPPITARGVRSKDKQSVTRFIEEMHRHLTAHDAFTRSARLDKSANSTQQLAEQLDKLVGEAADMAEHRCRRRRLPWYSSELTMTRQAISLLKYYANGLKLNVDRSKSINARLRAMNNPMILPQDVTGAQTLIRNLEQQLENLIRDSQGVRSRELLTKAAAANHRLAKTLNKINHHEHNTKTWKTLAFMSAQRNHQQLNRLDIPSSWPEPNADFIDAAGLEDPKSATSWKTITEPKAIEKYLMIRNCQHFGQAHGTPFTMPPLSCDIDWGANSLVSAQILDGEYVSPTTLPSLCTTLLQHCKALPITAAMNPYLTHTEFASKIKIWNERTTTSPSGRHLGRYKALYADSIYQDGTAEHTGFQAKQKDIITIILRIINHCIDTGQPLQRWKQVTNTMIFKDPGVYQIHRLRVIHIFEADLNLLYAVKWRGLLRLSDSFNAINPGQYGGRPGYEATSMALMEELRIDISYMTRRTLLTFDNDAASCYDRMVPNLVSLINRRNGMPKQLAQLHGNILQQTHYQVRTSVGISQSSYTNTSTTPLYGTGQGAGNSPIIWLLTSSLLFDVYDEHCHGARFLAIDGGATTCMGLSGFVDDTNAVVNCCQPQNDTSIEELLPIMQQDAQLWCNLLHLSGGKLELSKCSYHALRFHFQADGTPKPITTNDLPPLDLMDPETRNVCKVKSLQASVAHKILGHWKSPADPKQKAQINAITHKANAQALLIATSPVTRQGAMLAYNGKYVASLRYVLPQCWFPPKVLIQGARSSMPKIISKCGYAHTMPHALLYAPTEFAGAGFHLWSTIQGEGQIKHFIKHWRTNTRESVLLRITVSWAQWQAGIGKSVLEDVTTPLPHLESRWLPSLRQFLATIQGKITLDCDYVPQHERENDAHIMEFAIQSKAFSQDELKTVNYCRLYLHVATISELFDSNGQYLLSHIYNCQRPPWFDPNLPIAIQKRPSSFQRRYQWQRLCRMLCTSDFKAGQAVQLGGWTQTANKLRLRHEAYLQTSTSLVYVWRSSQYWSAHHHPVFPDQYTISEPTSWLPSATSIPVTITHWHSPRRLQIASKITMPVQSNARTSRVCSFEDHIEEIPMWERQLLSHITWHVNPYELMDRIRNKWPEGNTLLVVSDGSSIHGQTMSYGVVIGDTEGTVYLEAMGPAFGIPSSHRAECTGCLSGSLILHQLQRYTDFQIPPSVPVRILSDNQAMITYLSERLKYTTMYPNATLRPDWDLLEEIHQTYARSLNTQYKFQWVRGHQEQKEGQNLSPEAAFNVRADELANEYTIMVDHSYRPNTWLMPSTKCYLTIAGHDYQGNYQTGIRQAVATPTLHRYLEKRHNWTAATVDKIDWESFKMAARTSTLPTNRLMKLVHNKLPTNLYRSRYDKTVSNQCFFCTEIETFEHLCLSHCNPQSHNFRTNLVNNIQSYFQKTNAPVHFTQTVQQGIQNWFQSQSPISPTHTLTNSALRHQQDKIGWSQMIHGFLSIQWKRFYSQSCLHDRLDQSLAQEDDSVTSTDTTSNSSKHEWEYYIEPAQPGGNDHNQWNVGRRHINPTIFISGLIRTLWDAMNDLWTTHIQYIHDTTTQLARGTELQEVRNQIRALHEAKDKVLADHQDRYFHSNLENYLQQTPLQHMKNYLSRYRPTILHSIKQATARATSTLKLTMFPGFSRRQHTNEMLHSVREEPIHRKHTKIRHRSITDYFQPTPKTKKSPPSHSSLAPD